MTEFTKHNRIEDVSDPFKAIDPRTSMDLSRFANIEGYTKAGFIDSLKAGDKVMFLLVPNSVLSLQVYTGEVVFVSPIGGSTKSFVCADENGVQTPFTLLTTSLCYWKLPEAVEDEEPPSVEFNAVKEKDYGVLENYTPPNGDPGFEIDTPLILDVDGPELARLLAEEEEIARNEK